MKSLMAVAENPSFQEPSADSSLHFSPEQEITERCGIVGIRTINQTAQFGRLLDAGIGVQHRGQLGAGIRFALSNELGFTHVGDRLLRDIFTPDVVGKYKFNLLRTKSSMLHTRYGTNGGYEATNLQPCIAATAEGQEIAVIHNGQFVATDKMREELAAEGVFPEEEASDTRLFTELLAKAKGDTWDEKIVSTLDKVDGGFNLIIQVGDTMYAARDKHGLHPLVLGEIDFGDTKGAIIASETSALNYSGATYERYVKPGEILKVDDSGITSLQEGSESNGAFCGFEMAYFANMGSLLPSGEAFATFRERAGRLLAKRVKINADFVLEVPDSAIDFASGYASESGIPRLPYLRKTHFRPDSDGRLFQGDRSIASIGDKVLNKFVFIPGEHWKDAIVAVVDDSIVRGSESAVITAELFRLGVKEVHLLLGFPPVKNTCHLGISIRTDKELIHNRGDVATLIGANSVNYITPAEYIQAAFPGRQIKIPEDQLDVALENGHCLGCVTGRYPVSKDGVIWTPQGN